MKAVPATFQRMMPDSVLQRLESLAGVYIDNIEVDTVTTFVQHLLNLREVFSRLRRAKLHAKPSKCTIDRKTRN